jgi:phosphatidylglycerophosphate synthase
MSTMHVPAVRVHTSVLAGAEKRLLVAIAGRMPRFVTSDHLTILGTLSLVGVGACFWAGGSDARVLLLALPFLALNWFGDSLDGTLARVRREERPRYGYYVDHVLDAVGFVWIVGGLVLGGFMSFGPALTFLAAYYLLVVEISLATHARGVFRISFWGVGPTELRLGLGAGVLALLRAPTVNVFGHDWLLFDVGGALAAAAFVVTFIASAFTNGRALFREERLVPPTRGV